MPGWTRAQRMRNGQARDNLTPDSRARHMKNLGGFAWEEACSICSRRNHPTALCRFKNQPEKKAEKKKKQQSRELQGVACPTCNKTGHTSDNCPRKGQIVSFLARVDAAEEQFSEV